MTSRCKRTLFSAAVGGDLCLAERRRVASTLLALLLSLFLLPASASSSRASQLQDSDRVVFIGDSITGLGGNNQQGFVHLIAWALHEARPGNTMTFTALGGSGQTIAGWINVEEQGRQKDFNLDVPGVGVKTTLDRGADVVVVMLGMNDIISPSLTEEPKELDAWMERYRGLIRTLRERLHPRVVALGTITLATEDLASPKNRVIDQLNERAAALARQERCLVLPTNAMMREFLQEGRRYWPDFHVTGDYVHPNQAGQVAIALGMLKGLGEEAAVRAIEQKYVTAIWQQAQGKLPSLSCSVEPVDGPLSADGQTFRLHYWWTALPGREKIAPQVSVAPPTGWAATPRISEASSGEFTLKGQPDRLVNSLTVEARDGQTVRRMAAKIPAPWLIGTGAIDAAAWPGKHDHFDAVGGRLPMDASFSRGIGLAGSAAEAKPLAWRRYFPSANYTGGADPNNIDFWAAGFGRLFEVGYAARWIHSDRQRPVTLKLGSVAFAGNIGLTVWLNGRQLYAGTISGEPGKKASVSATLRQGENCLVCKCNHCQWLWQASVAVQGAESDDLGDVRIYAAPGPKSGSR
jgi:lysophospholipase L1-like esterase